MNGGTANGVWMCEREEHRSPRAAIGGTIGATCRQAWQYMNYHSFRYTQRLARTYSAAAFINWAPPSHPPQVVEHAVALIKEFQAPFGPISVLPSHISMVLDEWLLTTDYKRLTAFQKAICGCCLVELFVARPDYDRVSLSVSLALKCMCASIQSMSSRSLAVIRELLISVGGSTQANWDDYEAAQIRLATTILNRLMKRKHEKDIDELTICMKTILRMSSFYDLKTLCEVFEAVVNCSYLDEDVREVVYYTTSV